MDDNVDAIADSFIRFLERVDVKASPPMARSPGTERPIGDPKWNVLKKCLEALSPDQRVDLAAMIKVMFDVVKDTRDMQGIPPSMEYRRR